ncbi:MAG TPA: nucleotidyltransferase family protein [Phycisphaerae bacterium]|nr:nucleotidyltransferase family protein [Phycisphaerae bacterium]HOJ76041.1 nucleotidyltransferase family protein [Phycisphaerae bacterium]HOM53082.1 nucleotidyltransferase family protein [Phycisphaerae bacterium]HOQ86091.1 nucleotidyltransferase family protein [Phycisphaerae bacterium]HPP25843.1 nucleotidyltransferase family protein [Phycisphaerae bacterium]
MTRKRPIDPAQASQTPASVWPLIGRCLGDEPAGAFREVARSGLWEYVAAEACDAGVGAFLYAAAQRHGIDLPVSASRQMRAYREHVAAANSYQLESVRKALARLQIAKVPFLLLKGAALNAVLYEPGLRPMTDIDVLIRAEDVSTAEKVLRNAGCRPGADLLREDFYPKYYCEREYFTGTYPPVKIDLHCRPFHVLRYARTMPEGALWSGTMEAGCAGLTVRVPGPHSMLIHLCVHAACHGGTQLRWLYDIKCWLDRFGGSIDLDRLAAQCRRWRIALPVHRALTATLEAFGGNDLLRAAVEATDGFAGPLDRLAVAAAPLAGRAPVLHTVCTALTTPGLRFRLGYLAAVLLPGTGHLAQIYPHRHAGWQLAAHGTRVASILRRTLRPSEPCA